MNKLLILTLVATMISCGKNQMAGEVTKLHVATKLKTQQNDQIVATFKGANTDFSLTSKSFDQERGVVEFQKFNDAFIFELLAEDELEINLEGLEEVMFDGYKIMSSESNLSNIKRYNNEKTLKINKEEIRKFISEGLFLNFEKIMFEVNGVEITKKFEGEMFFKKTGLFSNPEELEGSQAKRFIERFFVVVKTPVFEQITKTGRIDILRINVPFFGAKGSAKYTSVVISSHVGYEFVESDKDFDSCFQVLSTETLHKDYKIKRSLKEARVERICSLETKSFLETTFKADKKIPKGSLVVFPDGSSTLLLGGTKAEYREEMEIRREIIPLYY